MAEKDSAEHEARAGLVAQANVLSRYAAQCENGAKRKEADSFEKEILTERATMARAMAGVMFRAGTASYEPEDSIDVHISHPTVCTKCRSEVKG